MPVTLQSCQHLKAGILINVTQKLAIPCKVLILLHFQLLILGAQVCLLLFNCTGRFIMFSAITNVYNKKTKGPTLMEFFTATGKLKKLFFFLTTRDVRCVHHR